MSYTVSFGGKFGKPTEHRKHTVRFLVWQFHLLFSPSVLVKQYLHPKRLKTHTHFSLSSLTIQGDVTHPPFLGGAFNKVRQQCHNQGGLTKPAVWDENKSLESHWHRIQWLFRRMHFSRLQEIIGLLLLLNWVFCVCVYHRIEKELCMFFKTICTTKIVFWHIIPSDVDDNNTAKRISRSYWGKEKKKNPCHLSVRNYHFDLSCNSAQC